MVIKSVTHDNHLSSNARIPFTLNGPRLHQSRMEMPLRISFCSTSTVRQQSPEVPCKMLAYQRGLGQVGFIVVQIPPRKKSRMIRGRGLFCQTSNSNHRDL